MRRGELHARSFGDTGGTHELASRFRNLSLGQANWRSWPGHVPELRASAKKSPGLAEIPDYFSVVRFVVKCVDGLDNQLGFPYVTKFQRLRCCNANLTIMG